MRLTKKQWIAVAVALVVVSFFFIYGDFFSLFTSNDSAMTDTTKTGAAFNQTLTNLTIEDISLGTGAVAADGSLVIVHYVGYLLDGTKFDSSYDRGQPFQFTLGAGEVISGWDQGILGMKVGGKRHLVIPASLAYAARAIGPIPANSTLVFDVELLAVK